MMWYDPEHRSLAGMATLTAVRTYDPETNVPINLWVARCVRIAVWNHWRKVRVRRVVSLMEDEWWERVIERKPESPELDISQEDWQLLYEKYVERWPIDVIAREHNTTVHRARKAVAAALARLQKANQNE